MPAELKLNRYNNKINITEKNIYIKKKGINILLKSLIK